MEDTMIDRWPLWTLRPRVTYRRFSHCLGVDHDTCELLPLNSRACWKGESLRKYLEVFSDDLVMCRDRLQSLESLRIVSLLNLKMYSVPKLCWWINRGPMRLRSLFKNIRRSSVRISVVPHCDEYR